MLSVCCEYRVMVQDYTIGLNETRLGISAPTFFQAAFRNVLSAREAEKALILGTMFSTDEALKVNIYLSKLLSYFTFQHILIRLA